MEIGAEAARRRLPELLDLAHAGETSIIKKRGTPYAALIPLDEQMPPDRGEGILSLRGSGVGLWGSDVSKTIHEGRDEWER